MSGGEPDFVLKVGDKVVVRPYTGTPYTGIITEDVGHNMYLVQNDQTGLENREYGSTLSPNR
jgi:hypothetical protein